VRSLKVFMAYDLMAIDDEQFLELLCVCRSHGALTLVHAENNAMIKWMTKRLLARGHVAPRYHAVSHPRLAEAEAVHRAIALAELVGAPLVVVHVSCTEALEEVRRARDRHLQIYAETCPQYLFLTAEDADLPGYDGAKVCFSPPPRAHRDQDALWRGLAEGLLQLYSSDHAPYRMDAA
jgi:dihydropyrimidinase